MTILLGVVLAIGVLLTASPWLFPTRERVGRVTGVHGSVRSLLAEAGIAFGPGVFAVLSASSAVLGGVLGVILTRSVLLGALAALAASAVPVVVLRARKARRIEARRAMWPDVCDLLVASVRSGMSLPAAVSSLSDSAPVALRPAFAAFARDMAASGHFDFSARRMKETLADATADRIIETLRMARQVGGTELPAVLRALSASVRAEVAVRGEVTARQSWTRGAAVLGVVAPWVILVLLLTRPEGAQAYATPGGVALIVSAAVVSVVAFQLMIRIGRLPAPRRWFG